MQFLLRKLRKSGIIKVQINTKTQQKSKHSAILKERQVLQYMGKDLKGKELGKGLTQRDDGRYNARAVINGVQICLFSHNLNHLKREFAAEKDKVLTKQLSAAIQTYTLDEWFIPEKAWLGPQRDLLLILALSGVENVMESTLKTCEEL